MTFCGFQEYLWVSGVSEIRHRCSMCHRFWLTAPFFSVLLYPTLFYSTVEPSFIHLYICLQNSSNLLRAKKNLLILTCLSPDLEAKQNSGVPAFVPCWHFVLTSCYRIVCLHFAYCIAVYLPVSFLCETGFMSRIMSCFSLNHEHNASLLVNIC